MADDRNTLEAARDALPPLPESAMLDQFSGASAFTAGQMRDYAAQAVVAALSSPPVLPVAKPLAHPVATEKDINRWKDAITERPEGPWTMGCGGSFDRTTIKPISDGMLLELAHWLTMGYTPWNGRSMPLSARDRQFMFLLYYSVQGLIARMREAEKLSAAPQEAAPALDDARDAKAERRQRDLGAAIEEAASQLPRGVQITVTVERDAGWVTVNDYEGNDADAPECDGDLAASIRAVIRSVMQQEPRS